jgi:hypothetical protein
VPPDNAITLPYSRHSNRVSTEPQIRLQPNRETIPPHLYKQNQSGWVFISLVAYIRCSVTN